MKYSSQFADALQFTCELHRDQVRKSTGVPYITHLLAVAALVGEDQGSEPEVIAALLHDAIEDQGGDAVRQAIFQRFGEEVAAIVEGCTDTDQTPKPPWRQRKEAFIRRLADAPASVLRVVAADKLHNARSIVVDLQDHGNAVWERFNGGMEGTLWYYRAVTQVLAGRGPQRLVRELYRTVVLMHSLAKPGDWHMDLIPKYQGDLG